MPTLKTATVMCVVIALAIILTGSVASGEEVELGLQKTCTPQCFRSCWARLYHMCPALTNKLKRGNIGEDSGMLEQRWPRMGPEEMDKYGGAWRAF